MSDYKPRLVFFDFVTHYGGAQRSTVYLLQHLRRSFDIHIVDPYGVCSEYQQTLQRNELAVTVLKPEAKAHYIGGNGSTKRFGRLIRQCPELWQIGKQLNNTISKFFFSF